jgi:hypothetical protein
MSERETPTGDPEQGADPRVLALLRDGTPANGLDLAPWWRANVAALATPPKRKSRSLQTWMQFAAVFVVGLSLGFVGRGGQASTPAKTQTCQYSESERSDLVAVLNAAAKNRGAEWTPRQSVVLMLCSTCHTGQTATNLNTLNLATSSL